MTRLFKLGIISFIVFFVLLLLMSLLVPSTIRISRAINIESPKSVIFPHLADTARWREWNEIDVTNIDITVRHADSGIIRTNWHYKGRDIQSSFRLEESAGITVVQWYFDFRLRWYPWEKFGSITLDKQFGIPMERSLENLQKVITKTP